MNAVSVANESAPAGHLLRYGLRVSVASIIWTVLVGAISVVTGLAHHSLVLIAFGLTGSLDAAGSTALVVHFRHGIKHDVFSEKHERIAFLVVTTGLIIVALATIAGSVVRLVSGGDVGQSSLGTAVAVASVFVLSALARIKRKVGKEMPSAALSADGLLSYTGALLAIVTLVGMLFASVGIDWADPVAACIVACGALFVAAMLHRQ